jgi:hypothetical protein
VAPNSIGTGQIAPDIVSSINGIHDDGGDISLVAGTNVTLTPNATAKTITIASASGGVTDVVAGGGLTGGGTGPTVTLNVGAGTGISVGSGQVSLDLPYADGRYVANGQAGAISTAMIQDGAVNSTQLAPTVTLGSGSTAGRLDVHSGVGGQNVTTLTENSLGGGIVLVARPDGSPAAEVTTTANGHAGFVGVFDSTGAVVAGIDGATGDVFGVTKSFVVAHPLQPNHFIHYTSIEGPEAAIYVRGRASLVNGRARVKFPEHFSALAVASSITLSLTPRSFDSKGLAAAHVTGQDMEVGELAGGTGSYEFDYVVFATRTGFEGSKSSWIGPRRAALRPRPRGGSEIVRKPTRGSAATLLRSRGGPLGQAATRMPEVPRRPA